jgi:hypothetical protein
MIDPLPAAECDWDGDRVFFVNEECQQSKVRSVQVFFVNEKYFKLVL